MEPFQRKDGTAKEPSLFLLSQWMDGAPGLTAGFSGRAGGVSSAPWNSLNIGLHVGDKQGDVIENRNLLTEDIGWPFEAWTCAEQIHGAAVHQVREGERGRGRSSMNDTIQGCDGIMTDVEGILLTSFYADCVPLYFFDPEHRAVALAHAGWRGTVGEIAAETVRRMSEAYGTRPERLIAAIGPSIGECCYEVDGLVITEVEALMNRLGLSEALALTCMIPEASGKARLNLKELNRQIMIKAGILPTRIELSKWCTGCRVDLFFSHRMEGGKTGRMASWIGLAER
ncbi:peptidoglycan editing factor PgeF [Paenibacillus sp. PAMC21692]|uniref:peptidoglycan editing factor PgeF n=1 Tax=Paenibacillus sp. PAMC21692 TaxID=2762320 RepID=UPI00164D640A|nr:peptidoglycan editing factor PgeF [Paenibacillus sp. PAMC21692]QNK54513.1 peptidoglycan editing factor PgeF [Paenibacillus sp. PAMC21692]